jgi:hypothetical protein
MPQKFQEEAQSQKDEMDESFPEECWQGNDCGEF